MKKTLNLALVLMATAVSLTLTSCGGGGGGGGGDATPNGGTNGGGSSNGGYSDTGYAPRTLDGMIMSTHGGSYLWEFQGNTAYLIVELDGYLYSGRGTYTYSVDRANHATLTITNVDLEGVLRLDYSLELNFHLDEYATVSGTQTITASNGEMNRTPAEFDAYVYPR